MATKRQSRVIVGRLFHRERVDLRAHQNLWGCLQLAETNKKRLLLNRSLSKHRLGLRWEKGDSAPLKTPGLLTADDGLREMMKALSGAVDGVGTSRCPRRRRRMHGPNSARTREGRGPLKASKRRVQLLTINIKFAPRRLV